MFRSGLDLFSPDDSAYLLHASVRVTENPEPSSAHIFSAGSMDDKLPHFQPLGSTPTILATKPSKEESGADLELRNAMSGAPAEYGADTVMQ